jgi:hypothetical protein
MNRDENDNYYLKQRDLNLNTSEIVKELYEWLNANEFNAQQLRLLDSSNEHEGRCVISKKDFKNGDVLARMPSKLLFNYRFAFKEQHLLEFFEWSHSNSQKLSRLDALCIYLIDQLVNESSFAHKFVVSMPLAYDTPEYYDESILKCLPIFLKHKVTNRVKILTEKYFKINFMLNEFRKLNDSNSTRLLLLIENFTYEHFKWSFCSLNSRCFHIDEKHLGTKQELEMANKFFGNLSELLLKENERHDDLKSFILKQEKEDEYRNNLCCMIPYLDFMNHSFESNAYASYDPNSECYMLVAEKASNQEDSSAIAIGKSEQIYITYGSHDSKTLLIEYGFVLENNTSDRLVFNIEEIFNLLNENSSSLVESYAVRANYLTDLSCNSFDGPSWYLLKTLDLICAYNENGDLMSSADFKLKWKEFEIIYPNQIRNLFTRLLHEYHEDLNQAREKLNRLRPTALNENNSLMRMLSHIETLLLFIDINLDIVNFNLRLTSEKEKWDKLF